MNLLTLILAMAALTSAGLIVWKSRFSALPGCGPTSSCDDVTNGRWSRLGGFKVATLGCVVYLLLVASLAVLKWSPAGAHRGVAMGVMTTVSILAIGAGIWFVILQAFIIRRWCIWCTGTHVLAVSAALLALRSGTILTTSWPAAMTGMLLVVLVILGQLLVKPKLYKLIEPAVGRTVGSNEAQAPPVDSAETASAPAKITSLEADANNAEPIEEREVRRETFFRGLVTLDANAWPIMGSRDAKHFLVVFFDYTCHHCRSLHGHLNQLVERYRADIAVVMVPVPMDVTCNDALRVQDPRHINACHYARCALAVWLADDSRFIEYDRWLFGMPTLPETTEAREKASQSVGRTEFEKSFGGDGVSSRLRDGLAHYMAAGAGPLPQVLTRDAKFVGQVPPFENFLSLMTRQLGLAPSKRTPAAQSAGVQAPPGTYVINIDRGQFGGTL